jgi:hypothetical protein
VGAATTSRTVSRPPIFQYSFICVAVVDAPSPTCAPAHGCAIIAAEAQAELVRAGGYLHLRPAGASRLAGGGRLHNQDAAQNSAAS